MAEKPAQIRGRGWWIVDAVRGNQEFVGELLVALYYGGDIGWAKDSLKKMHKNDRDALLQENGILTSTQIELLK